MHTAPPECLNILQREGLRLPEILTIAITGACNLTCTHCWVQAGTPSTAAHVPSRTICRLIEEFSDLGGKGTRFTGGEPLLHPDWQHLMRFARDRGFGRIFLQTNGMLLTDEAADALYDLDFPGLSIQVSLDGASAPSHELVRGKGTFTKTLGGIRRLVRRGLAHRATLFFTEMRHNLEEIPDLLELAESFGIGAVVTGTVVKCGRAAEGSRIGPPGPEQYRLLLERFEDDHKFRRRYEQIGTVAALEWRQKSPPRTESCTFVQNPYLTSDGRFYPCVLCHTDDFSVTDAFNKHLADTFAEGAPLWSKLLHVSRSRCRDIPECAECPGSRTCAGGCMGRAWGTHHDLMSPDDRCEVRMSVLKQRFPRN